MILSFDTEVSGLPDRRRPLSDRGQPRIVQLGAVLADANGKIVDSLDRLIIPDGWPISEEMTEVHGWTTELCAARGVPIAQAMAEFSALVQKSDAVTAYNLNFDYDMLVIERLVHNLPDPMAEAADSFCAMRLCADLLRIPDDRGRHRFLPLADAYRRLFGAPHERAHHALRDALACSRIVFKAAQAGLPVPGLSSAGQAADKG